MRKELVVFLFVSFGSLVGALWLLVASPAPAGGAVGRASGSRPASKPAHSSCCLIPANRGLKG